MLLAGIPVSRPLVVELVELLRDECYFKAADTLEHALANEQPAVGLTIRERTAILDVLDGRPAGLDELHAVLMAEHAWRVCEGLAPGRVV